MNVTANNAYTFGMATWEIIILLLLAFFLGMLLCWLLRKMGICCSTPQKSPSDTLLINKSLFPPSAL
jgi:hypothetical protein